VPDSKASAVAAALYFNDNALEDLDTLLAAFYDFSADPDGIAGGDIGDLQVLLNFNQR